MICLSQQELVCLDREVWTVRLDFPWENSKGLLGLSAFMVPSSPGFNFCCSDKWRIGMARWLRWSTVCQGLGELHRGHAHCMHASLHRPEVTACCLLAPLVACERQMTSVPEHQAVLLAEGRNMDLPSLFWPRLSKADSLVGSPWHCVKCATEGEEGLRPFLTLLNAKSSSAWLLLLSYKLSCGLAFLLCGQHQPPSLPFFLLVFGTRLLVMAECSITLHPLVAPLELYLEHCCFLFFFSFFYFFFPS